MDMIKVSDILNEIYEQNGIEKGLDIGRYNKKDFERICYYRGKNKLDEKEKRNIDTYAIILQQRLGIGPASANMILFRLGIFLSKLDVKNR